MTDTTLSRFSSQDSALRSPGCCITCKGVSGPFVDMNTRIGMFGSGYLCVNCLREMADVMGFFTPQVTIEDLNVSELKDVVNNYIGTNTGFIDSLLVANSRISGVLAAITEAPAQGDNDSVVDPIAGESEPASSEGSDGVSSDSSLGLFQFDGDPES